MSEFVKELPSSFNVSENEDAKARVEGEIEPEKPIEEESKYPLTSLLIIDNVSELVLTEPMLEGDNNRISLEKEVEFEEDEEEIESALEFEEEEEEIKNEKEEEEEKIEIEDIRVGVVVSNMYLKVWEREERRRSEDRQDLFEKTCELAAYIDGRMATFTLSKALNVLQDKKDMNWILNLGIIRKEEKRFSFYQPLTAVSFATEYLRSYYLGEAFGEIRERKKKISNNFSDDFKKSVEVMFESIEDVPVQYEKDVSSPKTTLMR